LELRGAYVDVLSITRGFTVANAMASLERIADLAESGGDIVQLIGALYGNCIGAAIAGDLRMAALLADRQLSLATRDGSPASLGNAHFSQFLTRLFRGDSVAAERHYALLEGHSDAEGFGIYSDTFARAFGAVCGWTLGHSDLARRRMTVANACAAASQSPFYVALAVTTESFLHFLLRDPEHCEATARAGLAIAAEHGFPQYTAQAKIGPGGASVLRGQGAEDAKLLRQGIAELRQTGQLIGIPLFLTSQGEGQALAGDTEGALATFEEALALNPEELIWRPGTLLCRGELRLKLGWAELGEADIREAIALSRKMTASAYELRATTRHARLLKARGDMVAARDLLAPIYARFTEGFDTTDLTEARRLVEALA
jgi:hypothetical protein